MNRIRHDLFIIGKHIITIIMINIISDLAMPIGSICSSLHTPLWPFQMGGEHLHKEQQEHQSWKE